MDVKVTLTAEEVKTAIKNYVNTQGMNLSVKEVEFAGSNGAVMVTCEKQKHVSGFSTYDR